jgi:hypothetical protein
MPALAVWPLVRFLKKRHHVASSPLSTSRGHCPPSGICATAKTGFMSLPRFAPVSSTSPLLSLLIFSLLAYTMCSQKSRTFLLLSGKLWGVSQVFLPGHCAARPPKWPGSLPVRMLAWLDAVTCLTSCHGHFSCKITFPLCKTVWTDFKFRVSSRGFLFRMRIFAFLLGERANLLEQSICLHFSPSTRIASPTSFIMPPSIRMSRLLFKRPFSASRRLASFKRIPFIASSPAVLSAFREITAMLSYWSVHL